MSGAIRYTAAMRRHFVAPKGVHVDRSPVFPAIGDWQLAFGLGRLAPDERKALAQIIDTAELFQTEYGPVMAFPVDAELLTTLCAFNAEVEDLEPCLEDEEETDDDRWNDFCFDHSNGVPYLDDFEHEGAAISDPVATEMWHEAHVTGAEKDGIAVGRITAHER